MLDHRQRIGGEAVDQYDEPKQRKEGKESVESDSSGYEPHIVVPHPLIGALDDILPGAPGHLQWVTRGMAVRIDGRILISHWDDCTSSRPNTHAGAAVPLLPISKNRLTVSLST